MSQPQHVDSEGREDGKPPASEFANSEARAISVGSREGEAHHANRGAGAGGRRTNYFFARRARCSMQGSAGRGSSRFRASGRGRSLARQAPKALARPRRRLSGAARRLIAAKWRRSSASSPTSSKRPTMRNKKTHRAAGSVGFRRRSSDPDEKERRQHDHLFSRRRKTAITNIPTDRKELNA